MSWSVAFNRQLHFDDAYGYAAGADQLDTIQVAIAPLCSNGAYASSTVETTTMGSIFDVQGWISLSSSSNNKSIAVPVQSTESTIAEAFLDLGYGDTIVNRSQSAFNTYQWDITFLEMTAHFPEVIVSNSEINSNSTVAITWDVIRAPQASCCLVGGTFILENQMTHRQSLLITRNSTSDDVLEALIHVGAVGSAESVFITTTHRPAGGTGWSIQFVDLSAQGMLAVDVVPVTPLLLQGGDTTQAVMRLTQVTQQLMPQTQRVLITGNSKLVGYFKLSRGELITNRSQPGP
jgi:hypothetical protein